MANLADVKVKFQPEQVLADSKRDLNAGMLKCATYILRTAKRLVRRTKTAKSKPGQPPRKHSDIFTNAFRYSVNQLANSVDLGAAYTPKGRAGTDGTRAPAMLEFGGRLSPRKNPFWYSNETPSGTGETAVAAWLKTQHAAPIYWGASEAAVQNKLNRHGHTGIKPVKRYSMVKGKFVWIAIGRIHENESESAKGRKARRGAEIIAKLFGEPIMFRSKPAIIAPRPLWAIAHERSLPFIRQTLGIK